MKTNKKQAGTKDRGWADRITDYRSHAVDGSLQDQLQALEARWLSLRTASEEVFLSDRAFFQQALFYAATPAITEHEARTKQAFLVCYIGIDADQGGQRLISTMIDAAIREEQRQLSCSADTQG